MTAVNGGSTESPASSSSQSRTRPSAEWLRSIDAVYSLFEDDKAAQRYPDLSAKVKNAVQLCEEVINDVGWQHCALSFNGGKDCTVLVHILSAVLRRLNGTTGPSSSQDPLPRIPSLYITCPSPFPTVEKFIKYCISPLHGYNLEMISVSGGMKRGIRTYLDGGGKEQVGLSDAESEASESNPAPPERKRDITAMFVGTRRDDPHGPQLTARSWTDRDWPRVERIHPILDWTYEDVWAFLRCPHLASSDASLGVSREQLATEHGVAGGGDQGVPYCLLYDQGYTSLGSTFNTLPNPELQITDDDDDDNHDTSSTDADATRAVVVGDGNAKGRWKPAYMLKDGSQERAGRVEQPKQPPPASTSSI